MDDTKKIEDYVKGVYLYSYKPDQHGCVLQMLHHTLDSKNEKDLLKLISSEISKDNAPLPAPLLSAIVEVDDSGWTTKYDCVLIYRYNTKDNIGRPAIGANALCIDAEYFKIKTQSVNEPIVLVPTCFSFLPYLEKLHNEPKFSPEKLEESIRKHSCLKSVWQHSIKKENKAIENLLSILEQKQCAALIVPKDESGANIESTRGALEAALAFLPNSGTNFDYLETGQPDGAVTAMLHSVKHPIFKRNLKLTAFTIEEIALESPKPSKFYEKVLENFGFFARTGELREELAKYRFNLDTHGEKKALKNLEARCPKCVGFVDYPTDKACRVCAAEFQNKGCCPAPGCEAEISPSVTICPKCGLYVNDCELCGGALQDTIRDESNITIEGGDITKCMCCGTRFMEGKEVVYISTSKVSGQPGTEKQRVTLRGREVRERIIKRPVVNIGECPVCGAKVDKDAPECSECGESLKED